VVSAVVTTVVMLFGGTEVVKEARDRHRAVVPPPPVVDDAAPPPPLDAAEAPTLEVTIETEPRGATIQQDGIDKGRAPLTTRVVVGSNHYTEFIASAPGYEDKTIAINALVDTTTHYKMVLKKLPKDAPPRPPTRPPDKKPPDKAPNKTGGELGGNPFKAPNPTAPPPKP
jgi:hypothetical protein